MTPRSLSILAGTSYVIIFFAAIFANFVVLESIVTDPLQTIQQQGFSVRLGIMAFLIAAVFDVVVAWALYELFKTHTFSGLSTLFRIVHAVIMAVAVFALVSSLNLTKADDILNHVQTFNTLWLIGLFFFGIHLLLLARILGKPKWIAVFLTLAGIMYMVDTTAHFVMAHYSDYASIFLALVALPSILGEMALAVWLLVKGGK